MEAAVLSMALGLVMATPPGLAEVSPLAAEAEAANSASGQLDPIFTANGLTPRIVNGELTSSFPSVGLLLFNGEPSCTGTLIGCQTFLTAAHCVEDDLNPQRYEVFFQHNGFYAVTSVAVAPGYQFQVGHDLAVLRLVGSVNGLAPTRINSTAKPVVGTPGTIVGFGRYGGPFETVGIKQVGRVTTASCQAAPDSTHVCWNFEAPVGPPGSDSNTCQGDSGGPLFITGPTNTVIAGVTSGGDSPNCLPTDHSWDADVFLDRAWIQSVGGSDLQHASCGARPPAGSLSSPVLSTAGVLSGGNSSDDFSFQVPVGTDFLLVSLNGESGGTDFDLFVNQGSPASPTTFVCESFFEDSLETCGVSNPTPGTWWLQARRFAGVGLYQVTVTLFGAGPASAGPCAPSTTTLCINDLPGDRRFSAEVAWNRTGALGSAGAIALDSLGVTRGGLFWIGNPANPEILLKVLNGCAINNHYWVFYSAGTNQGLDITVRDTVTGRVWTDSNPNGFLAPPVADTLAFPCT